jgi:putative ABC transport system permease protein
MPRATAWAGFDDGAILVSEPLAFRRGLAAGDTIDAADRPRRAAVPVAAVYRDYASEHGVIFIGAIARTTCTGMTTRRRRSPCSSRTADADAVSTHPRLPDAVGITSGPNRGLRAATLQVFDRTFVITGVLRLLALLVAFVGVTGALMALQLERAAEIARAAHARAHAGAGARARHGADRLMGLAAALLALPLGLAMAWAMVTSSTAARSAGAST